MPTLLGRALLGIATTALVVAAAACSGDDDAEGGGSTVVVTSEPATTTDPDETADDDEREYPSPDEVGRAEFTHIVVAGDFLSSIADTYGVEIDDIVGANEWSDGRDHLLLPGDEIYLPADAELPAEPPATDGTDADSDGEAAGEVEFADPSSMCADGEMVDQYPKSEGDTIEAVAQRLGLTVADIEEANGIGIFQFVDEVAVLCKDNWPAHVRFEGSPDRPLCTEGTGMAWYTVQQGDTADSIAADLGITVEQLSTENQEGLQTLSPSQTLVLCEGWFQ